MVLNASPLSFTGPAADLLALVAGATAVLIRKFSADAWVRAVETNHVTFTIPVSSHLHDLVEYIENDQVRSRSLRALVSSVSWDFF